MTNKEIYKLLDKFGMVHIDERACSSEEPIRDDADVFEEDVCADLVKTMQFVDDLLLNNDENTVNKFLVALFTYNNGEKNDTRN